MIKEYFIPCIVGHLLGTPIAVLPTLPICLSDGMCNNRQINARVVLKLGSSSHCLHRFRADDFIPSRNCLKAISEPTEMASCRVPAE